MAEIITAEDLKATKVGKIQESIKILNKAITAEKQEAHPNSAKIAKWQRAIVAYQETEKKVKKVYAQAKELGVVSGDVTLESILSLQTKLQKAGTSIEEVMKGSVNLEDIQDIELGNSWLGQDGALTNLAKGTGKDIVNGNGKSVGLSKALTVLGVASFATSGMNALLAASGSAATVGSLASAAIPNILQFAGTTLSSMFTFSPLGTTALVAMAAIKVIPIIARFTNKAISKYNQITRTRSLQEQLKANTNHEDGPMYTGDDNGLEMGDDLESSYTPPSEEEQLGPIGQGRPSAVPRAKKVLPYNQAVAQVNQNRKEVEKIARDYIAAMEETARARVAVREAQKRLKAESDKFDTLGITDITPNNQQALDAAQSEFARLSTTLKKLENVQNVLAGKYEAAMKKLRTATQVLTNSYAHFATAGMKPQERETHLVAYEKQKALTNMRLCDVDYLIVKEGRCNKEEIPAFVERIAKNYAEYGITKEEIEASFEMSAMASSGAGAVEREDEFADSLEDILGAGSEFETSAPASRKPTSPVGDGKNPPKKEEDAPEHTEADSMRDIEGAAGKLDSTAVTVYEDPAKKPVQTIDETTFDLASIDTVEACDKKIQFFEKKLKEAGEGSKDAKKYSDILTSLHAHKAALAKKKVQTNSNPSADPKKKGEKPATASAKKEEKPAADPVKKEEKPAADPVKKEETPAPEEAAPAVTPTKLSPALKAFYQKFADMRMTVKELQPLLRNKNLQAKLGLDDKEFETVKQLLEGAIAIRQDEFKEQGRNAKVRKGAELLGEADLEALKQK